MLKRLPRGPPHEIGHLCCARPTPPGGGTPPISLRPPKALVVALAKELCGGCFFCPSYSPPRPQKASEKKLRLENAWCVFLPPPISHHVHAQASGKIASRKIVCSCERVRRFLPAIFFGETPSQKATGAQTQSGHAGRIPSAALGRLALASAAPHGGQHHAGCRSAATPHGGLRCLCPAARRGATPRQTIRTTIRTMIRAPSRNATLINVRFAPKATEVLRCRKASLCAKRSRHPNQANGVRNVSFMRQAPKNETAAAAMIR
jgi:hypothetical protein